MKNTNYFFIYTLILLLTPLMAISQWTPLGTDLDGDINLGDSYGYNVSVTHDGQTIAVGDYRYNGDGNGSAQGHVQIFDWNGSSWVQRGQDIVGNVGDWLGQDLHLSTDGNRIAVGVIHADNALGLDAGVIRVFEWNGAAWLQRGSDLEGEGDIFSGLNFPDAFGGSVSMSDDGNVVVGGARGNDANGTNAGNVRVFEWNGTDYIQIGGDLDGVAAGDNFGYCVSLNAAGNILAVGARSNDTAANDAGQVSVFEWNGTNWISKGTPLNGVSAENEFGHSVSLDDSGNTLAVGASADSGGSSTTYAQVYDWNGSAWVQRGANVLQNLANTGDLVSLSADGNLVIVSSPSESSTLFFGGQSAVFAWDGSGWIQQGMTLEAGNSLEFFGSGGAISGDGHTMILGGFGHDPSGYAKAYEGCFDNRWVFDHVVDENTNYKARLEIELDNVTVENGVDLTVTAPEILIDNGSEIQLGATFCTIIQNGCQ